MRVELMILARNAWVIFIYSKHDIIKSENVTMVALKDIDAS